MGDKKTFSDCIKDELNSFMVGESNLRDCTIKHNLNYLIPLMVKKHGDYIEFFDVVDENYELIEQNYLLSPTQVKIIK